MTIPGFTANGIGAREAAIHGSRKRVHGILR